MATRPLRSPQAGGAARKTQRKDSRGPVRDSSEVPGKPAWGRYTEYRRNDEPSGVSIVNGRERKGKKLPDGDDAASRRILQVTFDEAIVNIEWGDEQQTIWGLRAVHNLVDHLDRKDLWDIMESIANAALDTKKSILVRTECLNKMIFLHGEIVKKAMGEGMGNAKILVGSKAREGRAQSGIPPVHFQVDREDLGEGRGEEVQYLQAPAYSLRSNTVHGLTRMDTDTESHANPALRSPLRRAKKRARRRREEQDTSSSFIRRSAQITHKRCLTQRR